MSGTGSLRSASHGSTSLSNGSGRSSRSSQFSHVTTGHTIADSASVPEADGRTYNGYREGKYYLPNDGAEQDRLDLQHHVCRLMMNGELASAPFVENGQGIDVLDIGTGTGIWAIEFADEHPTARVIGADISLIQPDYVPANCSFYREDSEEDPWVWDTAFDYIHLRAMSTCFNDPRKMIQRVYDHLRPGGWAEYLDMTFEVLTADDASEQALQAKPASFRELLRRVPIACQVLAGRDAACTVKYKRWMLETGFVEVVDKPILVPLNSWPLDPEDQRLGKYMREDAHDGSDSGRKLMVASGIPEDEVDTFLENVHKDIDDTSVHAYVEWRAVYGRKPFEYENPPEDGKPVKEENVPMNNLQIDG